jgi:hypothetical protein
MVTMGDGEVGIVGIVGVSMRVGRSGMRSMDCAKAGFVKKTTRATSLNFLSI